MSTADINSQSWGQMFDDYMHLIHEYPFNFSLWRPGGVATSNYYLYLLYAILFQYIPAVVIDILLMIFKKKTLWVYKKFTTQHTWDKVDKLSKKYATH